MSQTKKNRREKKSSFPVWEHFAVNHTAALVAVQLQTHSTHRSCANLKAGNKARSSVRA